MAQKHVAMATGAGAGDSCRFKVCLSIWTCSLASVLHICMSMYRRIRTYGFVQQHGRSCSSAWLLAGCRQRDKEEDVETDIPPLLEAEVYTTQKSTQKAAHTVFYLDVIDLMEGMEK